MLQLLFWVSVGLLFYSFIGYGLVLYLLVKAKRFFRPQKPFNNEYCPPVTLVVPCFNEAEVLEAKLANCRAVDYPKEKLRFVFITDGSTDGSEQWLSKFPDITVLHSPERRGKSAAENRAMQHVSTPVTIFSDANTLINPEAVRNIVRHFQDNRVGCVAGEKRILTAEKEVASAAGEGLYWKYESFLKSLDSQLYSAVGAAGELVAFRTSLFEPMPEDTILDDFMQSMFIAANGYRTVYEPAAYAVETAAASVREELKRKIRICAGGWQSIHRLRKRLTPWQQPLLFFQYLSHRVLRWTINPFLMVAAFVSNLFLAQDHPVFGLLLLLQALFYLFSFTGFLLEKQRLKVKLFFLPYYFCVMNYSVLMGLWRFLNGSQSAVWEKNSRMAPSV